MLMIRYACKPVCTDLTVTSCRDQRLRTTTITQNMGPIRSTILADRARLSDEKSFEQRAEFGGIDLSIKPPRLV